MAVSEGPEGGGGGAGQGIHKHLWTILQNFVKGQSEANQNVAKATLIHTWLALDHRLI